MRLRTIALLAFSAFTATEASAQAVGTQSWIPNLSGIYRCVQNCTGPGIVRVMQRGRELSLVNPVGQPSAAWIEATVHIWTSWERGGRLFSGWLYHPVCQRHGSGCFLSQHRFPGRHGRANSQVDFTGVLIRRPTY